VTGDTHLQVWVILYIWLGANTHLNQNTATNSHPPPCPVSQVLSARLRSSPLPPAWCSHQMRVSCERRARDKGQGL